MSKEEEMADDRPQWIVTAERDHPGVLEHATLAVCNVWRNPLLAISLLLKTQEERTAAIQDSVRSIYYQMLAAGEK